MDLDAMKFRILMLEAQKTGIEAEIKALRETKCPVCQGRRDITIDEPAPRTAAATTTRVEPCTACNQTGYALGEYPQSC